VRTLRPGCDILLSADPARGLDLPEGVLIDDYLSVAARSDIDDAAAQAVVRWREVHDSRLTVDGVCMPWLWEIELYASVFLPAIRQAVGLRVALASHDWPAVELAGGDNNSVPLVKAAGGTIASERYADTRTSPQRLRRRRGLMRGLRRALQVLARKGGVPSYVRSGAVVVAGYWQLSPVVDRMLDTHRARPALALHAPLPGARRALRMARRGGWVGLPGPFDRRWARNRAARLGASVASLPMDVFGCSLGELTRMAAATFVAERAATELPLLRLLQRTFRRYKVGCVVVPFDVVPEMRLAVTTAKSFGIPTIVVQHGAYLEPLRFPDLQVADTAVLWSEAAIPAVAGRTDDVVVVGYPGPRPSWHQSFATTPAIIVLGAPSYRASCLRDTRQEQRQYAAAIEAALEVAPDTPIVLRPHPSTGPLAADAMCSRYPSALITVDVTSDIFDLLRRGAVCIGTNSTAVMQAALIGTPILILNLDGVEFPWPLGGSSTTVPIARSREDLVLHLRKMLNRKDEAAWGQDDLLGVLGVMQDDSVEKLVAVIARHLRPPARRTAR
jgi:hypothetical protein